MGKALDPKKSQPKETRGEYRTLGIPTIRDRVVQMAVKMTIEPLWEADFSE